MSAVKNVIKDNYNMMLLKDYLREAIKDAGFSHAEISKTPTGTRVALHVTRPGIVIGRKGSGIRELTERLEKDFGLKNPQISVNEIEKPDLSPSVMCNRMASHLERGTAFRRYKNQVAHRADPGMMSGRYPQKTAKEFIKVLDNLESNAEYKGMDLDRLRIVNATVHKGVVVKRFTPRAMGRATAKNNVLTHVELVAQEL